MKHANYSSRYFTLRDRQVGNLSLYKQAKLASEALLASNIIELINTVINEPGAISERDTTFANKGIDLVDSLIEGVEYFDQMKVLLIPRPESADTVQHIKDRNPINIRENGEKAREVLLILLKSHSKLSYIENEDLQSARNFFRAVHTGIMDQLEQDTDDDLQIFE